MAIGDFNAKLSNWFCQDKTDLMTLKNWYPNLDCARWLKNQNLVCLDTSSSCIDLLFVSQAMLIIKSGVHLSLHSNCYHQIIFAKLNLEIIYVWYYLYIRKIVLDYGRFGTMKMLTVSSLDEQLVNSVGKGPF